jgi:hypothetical protein
MDKHTHTGCPVHRDVSFFDSVRDLVDENDRRLLFELEPLEDGDENRDRQRTIERVY